MSNLVTYSLDVSTLPAPALATPAPPELVAGAPTFQTWVQDVSFDKKVRSGIWGATPGVTLCLKPTTFEYCYIIEGAVEIAEDGGTATVFRAGDSFGLKPGFAGTWRTIETLKKFYVAVTL